MARKRVASEDDVSIRDYIDMRIAEVDKRNEQRFDAQEKAMGSALAAADKATSIQEANAEKWRASANEWRGAMSDRDRELPSRREVDTAVAGLEKRLRLLEDQAQTGKGRSDGIGLTTGVLVAVITLAATVIGVIVVLAEVLTP